MPAKMGTQKPLRGMELNPTQMDVMLIMRRKADKSPHIIRKLQRPTFLNDRDSSGIIFHFFEFLLEEFHLNFYGLIIYHFFRNGFTRVKHSRMVSVDCASNVFQGGVSILAAEPTALNIDCSNTVYCSPAK